MDTRRLLKTAISLLLAFAMTFVPVFSSTAIVASALETDDQAVAEENEETVPETVEETAPEEDPQPADTETSEPAEAVSNDAADTQDEDVSKASSEKEPEATDNTAGSASAGTVEDPAPTEDETIVEEKEIEHPAQTLRVTASDGALIVVKAPEGAFPEDSYVEAKPVPEEEVLALIDGAVEVAAYDITVFSADGKEVQPDKSVKVSMSHTGLDEADAVYHINDSMTKASLVTENIDQADDAFAVDHFSIYTVAMITDDYSKGHFENEITSYTLYVGETVALTSTAGGSSTGDPDYDWHVTKGDASSPAPGEGLSWETGVFQNRGTFPTGDWYYSYIKITALKPGVYTVENWKDRVDDKVSSVTITVKERYTVSFEMNGHGDAISSQNVDGNDKATKPQDPTADGYLFKGWYENKECTGAEFDFDTPVTENKTLYAKWVRAYNVVFKDFDGTVISEKAYEEGTPKEDIETPADPEREEDDDCVYAFAGWDNEITDVTADAEYTATYTETRKYAVTFKDYDGTQISTGKYVPDTAIADIAPEDPTRASTERYDYTFAGWAEQQDQETGKPAEELPALGLSDVTYYAAYSKTDRTYKIDFINYDGDILQSEQLKYGEMPVYKGDEPARPATPQFTYTFIGWDSEIAQVTRNATYGAKFTETVNEYDVTFVDDDGETVLLETKTYRYGTEAGSIVKPDDPTKPATDDYTYVFTGWDPEITTVTEEAIYKAKYQALDNYHIDVERIHAGDKATSAAAKEASDKTGVATTFWVTTQSDVDALKAHFAGGSGSAPDPFTDLFQAGETYYSVAMVDFAEGEEADVDRVSLNETEYVKKAGDPVVNTSENKVVVPFSVTIPAITVTVEFGSKHSAIAEQVAAIGSEGITMTANGGTLTYKAEKGSDRWFDVTSPLREALSKVDTSKPDNGEMMYSGYVHYNLHPIEHYANAEECSAEMDTAMDSVEQNEDLKLYILWEKPTEVEMTITKPICGTEVTYDESSGQQSPRPKISVTKGNAKVLKMEDSEYSYDPTFWVEIGDSEMPQPFTGKITGGETYRAMTVLIPDFGYYIDPDKVTARNGKLVDSTEGSPEAPFFIDVEAEHNWSDWKVTKEATTTAQGVETRECSACGEEETRPIDKLPEKPEVTDPEKKPVAAKTEKKPVLILKAVAKGSNKVNLTWTKVKGADRYSIYMTKCGTDTYKKVKTINGKKTKWTKTRLKKNKAYKFYVVAEKKVNGKFVRIRKSPAAHVVTGNQRGKNTNPKKLTVKKAKVTVKAGKKASIKASVTKVRKGKKLLSSKHCKKYRYISSDPSIVSVNASGKIKGKKAGTCKVYVFTINGIWKIVNVTVR